MHTPSEIVGMARECGLGAIAITDHDAVGGIPEAVAAATSTGIDVVSGVEISTAAGAHEVHILGYLIDSTNPALCQALARSRASRLTRGQRMCELLDKLGVHISWQRVQELVGEGAVGRPHVALALQDAGYVSCSQEAFDRYLGRGCPAYVAREKVSPAQAVDLIHGAGGVAVLAHPWYIRGQIANFVRESGVQGIEVYYTGYGSAIVSHLLQVARLHDLVPTGGSDFHSLELLPENVLGGPHVPSDTLDRLRACQRRLGRDAQ